VGCDISRLEVVVVVARKPPPVGYREVGGVVNILLYIDIIVI